MQSRKPPKVIFIGDSAVGKTSIIQAYTNKRFAGNYKATIGADFIDVEVQVDGRLRSLEVWDTAGQQRFNSLSSVFYRGSHCCVIVFDLTNSKSFGSVELWMKGFIEGCGPDNPEQYPFILLGNKIDLKEQRQVASESIETFLASHPNFTYMDVSAKNQEGLQMAVKKIGEVAVAQVQPEIYNVIELKPIPNKNKKRTCCK